MWEEDWEWDDEEEDYVPTGGEWVLMDTYEATYNPELTNAFCAPNERYYSGGDPGWWYFEIFVRLSEETGEVVYIYPHEYVTKLPEDSYPGFASVVSFVY